MLAVMLCPRVMLLITCLSAHGPREGVVRVDILGCSPRIGVERFCVCALLAMAAETVVVVGLAGHFIDGVGLVGASCWCGARFQSLGVEFRGCIGFGGFAAELMLRASVS